MSGCKCTITVVILGKIVSIVPSFPLHPAHSLSTSIVLSNKQSEQKKICKEKSIEKIEPRVITVK